MYLFPPACPIITPENPSFFGSWPVHTYNTPCQTTPPPWLPQLIQPWLITKHTLTQCISRIWLTMLSKLSYSFSHRLSQALPSRQRQYLCARLDVTCASCVSLSYTPTRSHAMSRPNADTNAEQITTLTPEQLAISRPWQPTSLPNTLPRLTICFLSWVHITTAATLYHLLHHPCLYHQTAW